MRKSDEVRLSICWSTETFQLDTMKVFEKPTVQHGHWRHLLSLLGSCLWFFKILITKEVHEIMTILSHFIQMIHQVYVLQNFINIQVCKFKSIYQDFLATFCCSGVNSNKLVCMIQERFSFLQSKPDMGPYWEMQSLSYWLDPCQHKIAYAFFSN